MNDLPRLQHEGESKSATLGHLNMLKYCVLQSVTAFDKHYIDIESFNASRLRRELSASYRN